MTTDDGWSEIGGRPLARGELRPIADHPPSLQILDVPDDRGDICWRGRPVGNPPRIQCSGTDEDPHLSVDMPPTFLVDANTLSICFTDMGFVHDGIVATADPAGRMTLSTPLDDGRAWVYELFPVRWADDAARLTTFPFYLAAWMD